MDTMTETTARPEDEPYPWRVAPSANTRTSVHILAPEPVVSFMGDTYPSLVILDVGRPGFYATRLDITLTGSAGQRAVSTAQLRAVADAIDAWTV